MHEREHLAPRPRAPRPPAELNGPIDERLEPEPPTERDREHHPSIHDDAPVIEDDLRSVRQIVHRVGNLLMQAAAAQTTAFWHVLGLDSRDRRRDADRIGAAIVVLVLSIVLSLRARSSASTA